MEDTLRVGVISSTHGVRGEVKVYPTTDDVNRFKKLKNRRPLADEIRDYLKNKGVEEKLIDKMVETALGMGWQDLDEDELQKKLDSFILIYGE